MKKHVTRKPLYPRIPQELTDDDENHNDVLLLRMKSDECRGSSAFFDHSLPRAQTLWSQHTSSHGRTDPEGKSQIKQFNVSPSQTTVHTSLCSTFGDEGASSTTAEEGFSTVDAELEASGGRFVGASSHGRTYDGDEVSVAVSAETLPSSLRRDLIHQPNNNNNNNNSDNNSPHSASTSSVTANRMMTQSPYTCISMLTIDSEMDELGSVGSKSNQTPPLRLDHSFSSAEKSICTTPGSSVADRRRRSSLSTIDQVDGEKIEDPDENGVIAIESPVVNDFPSVITDNESVVSLSSHPPIPASQPAMNHHRMDCGSTSSSITCPQKKKDDDEEIKNRIHRVLEGSVMIQRNRDHAAFHLDSRGDDIKLNDANDQFHEDLSKMTESEMTVDDGMSKVQPGAYAVSNRHSDNTSKKQMDHDSQQGTTKDRSALYPNSECTLDHTPVDETDDADLEAQVETNVRPGAFAVEGIEAANRRRSSEGFDALDDEDFEDEFLGCAPREVEDSATLPSDHSLIDSYRVSQMTDPINALDAELQVVVEGAVIKPEDEVYVDPKVVKRLRMMQYSILCFSLAAVGLVVGLVLSVNAPSKAISLGWKTVGNDIYLNTSEPQTYFGKVLVVTEDGSRVVAAAPGRDSGVQLNVGEVIILKNEVTTTSDSSSDSSNWTVHNKIFGNAPKLEPFLSLASNHNGTLLVVGEPYGGTMGQVFTYRESDSGRDQLDAGLSKRETLTQDAASDETQQFGYSVALTADGAFLVVGAPLAINSSTETTKAKTILNAGGFFCYRRKTSSSSLSSSWELIGSIHGENENETLGWSVAIQILPSTNDLSFRVAAGGPSHDGDRGLVRIVDFRLSNGTWSMESSSKKVLTGIAQLNRFGEAIAFSQDARVLAVGARGVLISGQVIVYREVSGFDSGGGGDASSEWIADAHVLHGQEATEAYGASVALSSDGSVLAIGAPEFSGNGIGMPTGRVEVFKFHALDKNNNKNNSSSPEALPIEGDWKLEGSTILGNTSGEGFGSAVALAMQGTRLVVGAPLNRFDGNVPQAGAVRVYDREY